MPQGGLRAQQFPSPFPRASSLVLFAPLYQWCLFGWKSYMTVARTSLARRSGMGSVTKHPDLPRLSYFSIEAPGPGKPLRCRQTRRVGRPISCIRTGIIM